MEWPTYYGSKAHRLGVGDQQGQELSAVPMVEKQLEVSPTCRYLRTLGFWEEASIGWVLVAPPTLPELAQAGDHYA
jgi:hypothetical protein